MKLLLVTLRKRAGSDDVSRRETLLEADQIRVGRGVAMEINLSDISVDFHQATLSNEGGSLVLRSVSDGGITVGGKPAETVNLSAGQEAHIGRYKFRGEMGRDGAEFVLTMEEEPQVATTKTRRAKRRIEQVLPSRRLLGWVASIAIIGVFVAWPMFDVLTRPGLNDDVVVVDGMARSDTPPSTVFEIAWSSGPISRSHSMIENDCAACHQKPFEMTTNNACLACHANTTNHADTEAHPVMALDNQRCASCHKEHNGGVTPTALAANACTTCHADIRAVAENSKLGNINKFSVDHTPFRMSIVVGIGTDDQGVLTPQVERMPFDPQNPPSEGSGLKFPHAKHLNADGMRSPNGTQKLYCADCHVSEAGGALMRPIDMERDCAGCHQMEFNAAGVTRPLPHANEDEVARIVQDYYIAAALEGGVTSESAPEVVKRKRRRRIAGENTQATRAADLSDGDRGIAIEWAKKEALVQMDVIFGTRLCGTCHEAQKRPDATGTERWRVMPAILQRHWMPKAQFNHGPHEAMDCTSCHNAPESMRSADVLMPQIDACKDCHTGEDTADGARDTCVTCHEYHIPGREPMSPEHARIFKARAETRQTSKVKLQ